MEDLTRTLKFISEEGFFFPFGVMLLTYLKAIGAQPIFSTGHLSWLCFCPQLPHLRAL